MARRALGAGLLLAAALLLTLHFVHLQADFPNHSPWMDWSKYTDEGWYGDGAIRHFLLGHWYVPGDFNPAAALPVLPALEGLLFTLTGVSLVAVRALTVTFFVATVISAWFLLARRADGRNRNLTGATAVLLLAASPFCFVFTRIAILEPLLILLTLCCLLLARTLRGEMGWRGNRPAMAGLGVLLPVLVLTKTTALFLMPAIFWMILARAGYRVGRFLRLALPVAALAGGLWLAYFLLVVRRFFLADYRYLFSANAYTGMTLENFATVLANTVKDGAWMGGLLYWLALASAGCVVAIAIARPRRLAAQPEIVSLLLWIAGYTAFLAYHNNLQPRYYLVIAVPLTLLLVTVWDELLLPRPASVGVRRLAITTATAIVLAIAIPDALTEISYVRHPEYTLLHAAQSVAQVIRADQKSDPAHNPLILSISGSDISLITGLPSICDDFGTLSLTDRIKRYKPGWYVAWNQLEDDKLDAMWPQYQLQRVAAFPAMDDPDRNLMILYKVLPATEPGARPVARPALTPRRLRTRVGQQPSVLQLEH